MTIITQELPVLVGRPRIDFVSDDFDVIVYQKGYEVVWEQAIKCPCRNKNGGNNSSCHNCRGTGWVMINPIKTKMILQSLSVTTKYKDWTEEKAGTVGIVARHVDQLSDMDRITIVNSSSIYSQIIFPKIYTDQLFGFLVYEPDEVIDVFLYQDDNIKLKKLVSVTDYNIDGNKIILDSSYQTIEDITISVRYRHKVQIHVIDLTREIRNSYVIQSDGIDESKKFPVSAIGRRAHYVLDEENFEGDYMIDNSY